MTEIDKLIKAYERQVQLPWIKNLPPPQRVWFLIYDKLQERRLRLPSRMEEFRARTLAASHGWSLVDLSDTFADWMGNHEYRLAYFEDPEAMHMELSNFEEYVTNRIAKALADKQVNNQTVVAVIGVGSLFGLVRTSDLLPRLEPMIQGRLLVFFPGSHDGPNYHLLDARDGWNYRAVPISIGVGGL